MKSFTVLAMEDFDWKGGASRTLPFFFFAFFLILNGCGGAQKSSCLSCHRGIEHVSPSHPSCVSCHGGNETSSDKNEAHRGMYGGKNPSAPEVWEKACGSCHLYQLGRMKSNLMFTSAGMIRNIRLTWEGGEEGSYAAREGDAFAADGKPQHYQGVADLNNISGELYRKFCSLCHVGNEANDVFGASHSSGCAACHFPYNDTATYVGKDKTVKGKRGYSENHRMENLPENAVCSRCHNRSGRIAYSYQGLYDGNNSLVPTRDGHPGPVMTSGGRNLVHIVPDIHFEKGMDCIDCHTSRDVMGDGYAYPNMYVQTEISCEDCHGDGRRRPRLRAIDRENDEAVRESRHYKMQMRPGMSMVVTAKGRNYSNVFSERGKIFLLGKRSGKLFESKVVTGTPEHTVAGHGRMECYSCHSKTVVQCYGCHTRYDKTLTGYDFIKDEETPGRFTETEDYRMLYPFPLALNQRGKISPVTPGCQTFVTVVEEDGHTTAQEEVSLYKGKKQLRFAPFYGHNTGKKALTCRECHGNPSFLGFGQHVVEGKNVVATMICEKSADKPLDGFLTLEDGVLKPFAAITRENSRPLNTAEVRRALEVNLCLVCHDGANDPIYRKEIDRRALEDALHRRLLGR